jgi:hypothetical protein
MKMIESFNKTELSKLEWTPYSRIEKDVDLFIPIKIETAQSRATKRWYTVRYVRTDDVVKYLDELDFKKSYVRLNDKKYKKVLQNK